MSVRADTSAAELFREFCLRWSRAERMYRNARSTEWSGDRQDASIAAKQAIEAEFAECFALVRRPNWDLVQARADGLMERAIP